MKTSYEHTGKVKRKDTGKVNKKKDVVVKDVSAQSVQGSAKRVL